MNRSFTARLSARTPRRLRDYLWATHRLFNESLAYLLKHYFWMQNLTDRPPEQDKRNQLRVRFAANTEQLDRLRAVYLDMMGLPGMGLEGVPKNKRAGRSQSAQAWLEPITFSSGSTGEGPGESSKNIHPKVKEAIRALRRDNEWLFDRELAFPVAPDNGFRRGLFGTAARRILNFEQNQETHRGYYEDARKSFERWTGGQHREDVDDEAEDARRGGWRRTVPLRGWGKNQIQKREAELDEVGRLNWTDFETARIEFEAYERERSATRARDHGQRFDGSTIEQINGAMVRGWRDIYERLMLPDADAPPDKPTAERVIKEYQTAEPRKIGDINLFLWLSDKPHLWRFVETMRRYNDFQRKLEQYSRPIQFRYPRYSRRPEWFSFSETSPGHMYTIVSMHPMVIELSVFVPADDAAILKKLTKGQPLTDEEQDLLESPIDWKSYQLTKAALENRHAAYRAELDKKKPNMIAQANLDAVHDWTNNVSNLLMEGFFREDSPLDMSRFARVAVRYAFAPDRRLGAVSNDSATNEDVIGRAVVVTDDRQGGRRRLIARTDHKGIEIQEHPGGRRPQHEKWPKEQGMYAYWFGPLLKKCDGLGETRQFMRLMPLVFGGIRLEYRESLLRDANPTFTFSCDLDDSVYDSNNERMSPKPRHRLQSSRLGKPLKRDGWVRCANGTILCRFRERRRMAAVGVDAGLSDEVPVHGVRLIRGIPRNASRGLAPRPVIVEAVFDVAAGWDLKPEGLTGEDQTRFVEDFVAEGGTRRIAPGFRALLIDLGMRHIATGAVVEFVDDGKGNGGLPTPFKPEAVEFIDVPGVTLSHIQRHQDERRRKQRKACPRGSRKAFEIRGAHLPRGQEFARELLEHAENLKDDRRKKAAHAILRAALKHRVDYIVFENLKGYRPEMEFGRRYNAALMNWNRRELVEFVKMEAAPFGIHTWEFVPPHHTSRFCHRCGAVGSRFTHVTAVDAAKDTLAPAEPATDKEGKPLLDAKGKPVFRRKWTPSARRVRGTPLGLVAGMRQAIDGGKHFCCTECGLMVNADYNAAMNLARKLADSFPAYQRYRYDSGRKSWSVGAEILVGKAFWDRAKAIVQRRLNGRFSQPPDTPPAGGWPDGFQSVSSWDTPF